MIEINGGKISAQDYTANKEKDLQRKTKHVRYLMNLFKELDVDDWHTITVDTLHEWIIKLSELTNKEMRVHKVFHPKDLEKDLAEMQFLETHKFKNNLEEMMKTGRIKQRGVQLMKWDSQAPKSPTLESVQNDEKPNDEIDKEL